MKKLDQLAVFALFGALFWVLVGRILFQIFADTVVLPW